MKAFLFLRNVQMANITLPSAATSDDKVTGVASCVQTGMMLRGVFGTKQVTNSEVDEDIRTEEHSTTLKLDRMLDCLEVDTAFWLRLGRCSQFLD